MQPEFQLSPEEFSLVENSSWLIAKHRIIGKVSGMFGLLSEKYSAMLAEYAAYLPPEIMQVSPKIYKGERYRQLPYVMLDQPRYFRQEDAFAIRTFFWWGNNFSIHLLLGGKYREMLEPKVRQHVETGELDHWYLGVSAQPWDHHFDMDNYRQIADAKKTAFGLASGNYLKLGIWHPLHHWKDTGAFFIGSYKKLLEAVV